MIFDEFSPSRTRRTLTAGGRTLRALGLDGPLTGVLAIIVCIGVLVVYSASGQNIRMVEHHLANIAIAVAIPNNAIRVGIDDKPIRGSRRQLRM